MRIFCAIVQAQGFSAAARRLDSTHASVSRSLKQLETHLGVQLVNRTTRQLSLTAAGERYYASCLDILQRVQLAQDALEDSEKQVHGPLRVSVPLAIGTLELPDWLPGFQKRYPDIELMLSCTDQMVELVSNGLDLALRISDTLPDSTLKARTLTESPVVLVAAPSYLARHGVPTTPAQLQQRHTLLTFFGTSKGGPWLLADRQGEITRVEPARRSFSSDAITTTYAAVLTGLGIAAFTQRTVQPALDRGSLVRVLPDHIVGKRTYYAVYPHTRHLPSTVRAFIAYMAAHYGGHDTNSALK